MDMTMTAKDTASLGSAGMVVKETSANIAATVRGVYSARSAAVFVLKKCASEKKGRSTR